MKLAFWRSRSVSVLTWNVWFGLEKPLTRWTRLLSETESLKPDLILLQEVTAPFLELLRKQKWIRKSYEISDPRGEAIASYGSVIVSRSPLRRREVVDLDSEMDRKLVVIETEIHGILWTVGTVHLESLDTSAIRARQLEQVFGHLDDAPDVILGGDFNFCSSWPVENERLPADYVDVWPSVSAAPGFTVDSELNATRARKSERVRRERFDRILVRSSRVRPTQAVLVGTDRIRRETPDLFPSDHFGVFAKMALSAG